MEARNYEHFSVMSTRKIQMTKSEEGVTWSPSLDYYLATLRNGRYTVVFKRDRDKRTLQQNALMWMWLTCIARETGQPVQDVHDTYCARFLRRAAVSPRGDLVSVYGQTSKLSTAEMSAFMEQVQADAAEMGIRLPRPEDAYYQDFVDEYENSWEVWA